MDERKKLIFIVLAVFVWGSSLLVWGGWWAQQRNASEANASANDGQAEADTPRTGGSVTLPLYEEVPRMINPLSPDEGAIESVLPLIFEPLVETGPEGSIKGLLAEDWSIKDDGQTVTVRLRKGVKWHDGKPFTANDVVFTYDKLADPDYKGPYSQTVQTITGVKDVKSGAAKTIKGIEFQSNEKYKLTFHLDKPLNDSMELMQIPIIPRHIYKQSDEPKSKQVVGTGPYQMTERTEQDTLELKRFAGYWNEDQPYLDTVAFRVMTAWQATKQFAHGALDILPQMDASSSKSLLADSSKSPLEQSGDVFHYIAFNPKQKLWKDGQLRTTVGEMLDKQQIVKKWLNGYGEKVDTPRGTQVQYSNEKTLEKAVGKLKKEKLTLHYTSEWVEREALAKLLRKQWEAGRLNVKLVEHKDVKKLTKAIQSGEADMFLMTDWVRSEPDALFDWWSEDDLQEWTRWPAKEVTSSLKKAAETDGKERERLIREWDELFVKEAPMIPLVRPEMLYFVSDDLHGVKVEDFASGRFNVRGWWVENKPLAKNSS